ncbi:MAG: hypothetical protein VCA38_07090 [Roseibacillus sp.]
MSDRFLTTHGEEQSSRPKGKPHCVVRHQSASVPICAGAVHGKTRYTIAFYLDGRRRRRMFTDLGEAKREAKLAAQKIQRGLQSNNDLRPAEREAFLVAQRKLKGIGIPLVTAVEEYVTCREKLGEMPLLAIVEDYLSRTRGLRDGVTVPEVAAELIDTKRQDGMSKDYLTQLSNTFGLFEKAFPGPITLVRSEQIDGWLREGNLAPVTRNNRLTLVRLLFNFAKQRNYLPKSEATEAESLRKVKSGATETEIFEPEGFEKLLLAASRRLIPLLAIGGFAGLRAAELSRLNWKAVNLERGIIQLRAGQAKTASRRIVPISDNLAAWLELVDREGMVIQDKDLFRQATALARKQGLRWPRNVLRHSFHQLPGGTDPGCEPSSARGR